MDQSEILCIKFYLRFTILVKFEIHFLGLK